MIRYRVTLFFGFLSFYRFCACPVQACETDPVKDGALIGVYAGGGVADQSLAQAMGMLGRKIDQTHHEIKTLKATDIQEGDWMGQTDLLIMPGGIASKFREGLGPQGEANLLKYVTEEHGKYLGFCAGAYYGAATVDFARGLPTAIFAKRLGFFPGTCVGPAVPPYTIARCEWQGEGTLMPFDAYCEGGGYFTKTHPDAKNCTVLATYHEEPARGQAAIVEVTFPHKHGTGIAILSGPHIEYDASGFLGQENDATAQNLHKNLTASEAQRSEVLDVLLRRLGVKVRES